MTSEQPIVRRATMQDVAEITALTAAAYTKYIPQLGHEPQPMGADYAQIVGQHPTWLLATDQRLVGVLVLQHEADSMLIYSVAIHPADQKRGYGRFLLAWAEREALLAGYTALRLYTNARMEENIALYTRLGYHETGRETYQGGAVVHMSKRLAPGADAS